MKQVQYGPSMLPTDAKLTATEPADSQGPVVCETARLCLRRLHGGDAALMLEVLNDPDFVRYVGDRQVRTHEDAERYIRNGPEASYARWGFGLYRVEIRASGQAAGICGLLRRDGLDAPDVGFALLPPFRRAGYAFEAAAAALRHDREVLHLGRIVAVTDPGNIASRRVLERLGMTFDRMIRLPGSQREICLFALPE